MKNRLAFTPVGVTALSRGGHKVLMEKSAGTGSGFDNESYIDFI